MPELLQLPDETLIEILKLLSSSELMVVSRASTKLNLLRLGNKTLSKKDLDFSDNPFELQEMAKILDYLHEDANSLTLEGKGYLPIFQPTNSKEAALCNITGPLMTGISSHCENLKHLTLKKAWLPPGKIKIEHIPQSLTHLSLVGGKMHIGFFQNIETALPSLEYLRIEDDKLFSGHDFDNVKKHKNIQTLIVKKCSVEFDIRSRELNHLKVFDVSDCIFNYGYCYLAEFSFLGLRELSITADLSWCMNYLINGYGYEDIDRRPLRNNLEKLTLVKCKLKYESLYLIARDCTNLKHVSLVKCSGISDVEVTIFENMLKEKNSSCEVVYVYEISSM